MVKPRIEVPQAAMQKCDAADKAANGEFVELFRNHVELRGQYESCKVRHNVLVDRINELNGTTK